MYVLVVLAIDKFCCLKPNKYDELGYNNYIKSEKLAIASLTIFNSPNL